MWWVSLSEAPPDVLEFLEFLLPRYSHVDEALAGFKAAEGSDQFGHREFEEGLAAMNCHKFDGHDRSDHVTSIFQYFDPNEQGHAATHKLQHLSLLWQEMNYTLWEFKRYVERLYDSDPKDV